MTTLEQYWNALPKTGELDSFDEEKSRAFLDLLIIMAMADDVVTAIERLGFAQAILSLPHFELEWSEFESPRAVAIVGEVKDRFDDDPDATLAALVSAFEPRERGFVFAAILRFTTPDGWSDEEHAFARKLGAAFGFDDDETERRMAQALLREDDELQDG